MAIDQPRGVPNRRKDEREFEKEMRREYLVPFLKELAAELQSKPTMNTFGWIATIAAFVDAWRLRQTREFPVGAVERWASELNYYHKNKFIADFRRSFRVDIRPALQAEDMQSILRRSVNDSIGLIKTIPGRFAEGYRERAMNEIASRYTEGEMSAPLDLRARERMFRQQGRVAGYDLRRITRDQSNKLTGKLTEARQTAIGVEEYVWDTSEDDRVRPSHSIKQGQKFKWNDPPSDTGHPGNDIQCRCIAIPAIIADEIRARSR